MSYGDDRARRRFVPQDSSLRLTLTLANHRKGMCIEGACLSFCLKRIPWSAKVGYGNCATGLVKGRGGRAKTNFYPVRSFNEEPAAVPNRANRCRTTTDCPRSAQAKNESTAKRTTIIPTI